MFVPKRTVLNRGRKMTSRATMVKIIKQKPRKKMLTDLKLQGFVWKRNIGKAPWGYVRLP